MVSSLSKNKQSVKAADSAGFQDECMTCPPGHSVPSEHVAGRGQYDTVAANGSGSGYGHFDDAEESSSGESDVEEMKYYRGGRRPPSPPPGEKVDVMIRMRYGFHAKTVTIGSHKPLKKAFDEFESSLSLMKSQKIHYLGCGQVAFLPPSTTPKQARLKSGSLVSVFNGAAAEVFRDIKISSPQICFVTEKGELNKADSNQGHSIASPASERNHGDSPASDSGKESEKGKSAKAGKAGSASQGIAGSPTECKSDSFPEDKAEKSKSDNGESVSKAKAERSLKEKAENTVKDKAGSAPTALPLQLHHLLLLYYSDQYLLNCFCCASRYAWQLYRCYPSRESLDEQDQDEIEQEKARRAERMKGNNFRSSLSSSKPPRNLPFIVPVVTWFKEDVLCAKPEKCTCVMCSSLVSKTKQQTRVGSEGEEDGLEETPADANWRYMIQLQPDSMRSFVRRHGFSGDGTEEDLLKEVRWAWDLVRGMASGEKSALRRTHGPMAATAKIKGTATKEVKKTGVSSVLDYSKWDNLTDSGDDSGDGRPSMWTESAAEGWEILEDAQQEVNVKQNQKIHDLRTRSLGSDMSDAWSQYLMTCNCCASRYYWDMRYYKSKGKARCSKKFDGGVRIPRTWLDTESGPPNHIPFVVETKAWYGEEYLCGHPENCHCGPCALVGHAQVITLLEHQKLVGESGWQWLARIRPKRGSEFWEWYWQYLEHMDVMTEGTDVMGPSLKSLVRNLQVHALSEQGAKEIAFRNWDEGRPLPTDDTTPGTENCEGNKDKGKKKVAKGSNTAQKNNAEGKKGPGKDVAKKKSGEVDSRRKEATQKSQKKDNASSTTGLGGGAGGGQLTSGSGEVAVKPKQSIDYSRWEHIADSDDEKEEEEEELDSHHQCSCANVINGFEEIPSSECLPWDEGDTWFSDFYMNMCLVKDEVLEMLKKDKSKALKCKMIAMVREHLGPERLVHLCLDVGMDSEDEYSDKELMLMLARDIDPLDIVSCLPASMVGKLHRVFTDAMPFPSTSPYFKFLRTSILGNKSSEKSSEDCYPNNHVHKKSKLWSDSESSSKAVKESVEAGGGGGEKKAGQKAGAKSGRAVLEWSPLTCSFPPCRATEERPK